MDNPKKCEFFTKQFQKKRFSLNYDEPSFLGTSHCNRYQVTYIIYRALWCLWWIAFLLYYAIDSTNGLEWFTFLTHWSLLILAVSSILQLVSAVYSLRYYNERVDDEGKKKTPLLYKFNWALYLMSSLFAFLVTLVYWVTLYGGESVTFNNAVVHAVNSVYVIIDVWIIGVPVWLLHFYIPLTYGWIYVIFTIIHWLCGGSPIYPILDWGAKPGLAVGTVTILSVVGAPCLHLILFCLYWLRALIYDTMCSCYSQVHTITFVARGDIENARLASGKVSEEINMAQIDTEKY